MVTEGGKKFMFVDDLGIDIGEGIVETFVFDRWGLKNMLPC